MVSVIVRTKDRLDLLRCAIMSVVEQTYRPLELVLVNDGGQDVLKVAEQLLEGHDVALICIQHEISYGRSGAANAGLMAASGRLGLFLDDDDYIDAHHIETLVTAHRSSHSAMPTHFWIAHSRARAVSFTTGQAEQTLSIHGHAVQDDQLFYENFLPILTVLFPIAIRELDVRFDDQFEVFEDWDFWLQLSAICSFVFVDQVSSAYRIHAQGSGVRDDVIQYDAYQKIYRKWLPTLTSARLTALLASSHLWHERYVRSLQQANQTELNRIGDLHSTALMTIQAKDAELAHLTTLLQNIHQEMRPIKLTSPYFLAKRCVGFLKSLCHALFARKH